MDIKNNTNKKIFIISIINLTSGILGILSLLSKLHYPTVSTFFRFGYPILLILSSAYIIIRKKIVIKILLSFMLFTIIGILSIIIFSIINSEKFYFENNYFSFFYLSGPLNMLELLFRFNIILLFVKVLYRFRNIINLIYWLIAFIVILKDRVIFKSIIRSWYNNKKIKTIATIGFLLCFLIIMVISNINLFKWHFLFSDQKKLSFYQTNNENIKDNIKKSEESLDKLKKNIYLKEEVNAIKKELKDYIVIERIFTASDINFKKDYNYQKIQTQIKRLNKDGNEIDQYILKILTRYYMNKIEKEKKHFNKYLKNVSITVYPDFSQINLYNMSPDNYMKILQAKVENNLYFRGLENYKIKKNNFNIKIIIYTDNADKEKLYEIIRAKTRIDFKYVVENQEEILKFVNPDNLYMFDKYNNVLPEYKIKLEEKYPDYEILYKEYFSNDVCEYVSNNNINKVIVKKESLLGDNVNIVYASVEPDHLEKLGINFEFGQEETIMWEQVTGEAAKNRSMIAIILNNVVLIHPYVMEKIPNGRSRITLGDKSKEKLEEIALILMGSNEIDMKFDIGYKENNKTSFYYSLFINFSISILICLLILLIAVFIVLSVSSIYRYFITEEL